MLEIRNVENIQAKHKTELNSSKAVHNLSTFVNRLLNCLMSKVVLLETNNSSLCFYDEAS